jgi:hypothetical protein
MNPTDPASNVPPSPAEDPDDFKAMMIGAGFIFVITFIPYSFMLCCLPQIFGALLAIHLFTKWHHLTLTYGEGIKLGILTALLGGLAAWVVAVAVMLLFHYQFNVKEVQAMMLKIFSHFNKPEMIDKMKEAFEAQKAQGLTFTQLLIGLCSTVVTSAICGLIGGALGTALFKRGPAREAGS